MTQASSERESGSTTIDGSVRVEVEGADTELDVRPLRTSEELDACVRLQRKIWGMEYGDIVPASLLKVSQNVGGVAVGAFVNGDEAVGFVYGITGVRDGRLTHWSHMLGVLEAYRGRRIGTSLKLLQRDWLMERGVMEMRWTFDPLVSGNAHFNLNILGVRIHSYVPEMYNDTGSGLHSFGTDRFIAHWDLSRHPSDPAPRVDREVAWDEAPILASDASGHGMSGLRSGDGLPQAIRIEIPPHIMAVNATAPARAMAWRRATRRAFLDAWREGYRVVGFARSPCGQRCHYQLLRSHDVSVRPG